MYRRHSKLNHGCAPNAVVLRTGVDVGMVVRAVAPIRAGDEICICYLNLETAASLEGGGASGAASGEGEDAKVAAAASACTVANRRRELHERYSFWCSCARCLRENNPSSDSDSARE